MYTLSKEDVIPVKSQHGEVIYELIGRDVGAPTERHSLAYVVIPPGRSSLLHYHPEAEESYYILCGRARLRVGEEEAEVAAGQTVLIPAQQPHQIVNIGDLNLELLAFCVPAWEAANSVFLEKTEKTVQ